MKYATMQGLTPFGGFTYDVKTLGDFYVARKNVARAGFSLVELLVAVAAVALLAALLIPALPAAKAAADAAVCRSNLRQLAAANLAYAADHGRYVAAAADIEGANSIRWHGVRSGGAFDGSKGPLAPYLGGGGASAWVRRCPGFQPDAAGFEASDELRGDIGLGGRPDRTRGRVQRNRVHVHPATASIVELLGEQVGTPAVVVHVFDERVLDRHPTARLVEVGACGI